jgi:IclR family transcriptional regulator, pca regulon regulatory protein
VVDQQLEIGSRSIAVPVRDNAGQVVAAMNIAAHASVVAREVETTFLGKLETAVAGLGASVLA